MKNFRKAISILLASLVILSSFAVISLAQDCAHFYTATSVAPTCVEDGYTLYVCQYCGNSYKDYANGRPATGHNYSEWFTVNEATCNNEGHEKRTCSTCGAADIKTLPVVDHIDADRNGKCDFCDNEMDVDVTVSPFDWLVALFNAIIQFFRDIFA